MSGMSSEGPIEQQKKKKRNWYFPRNLIDTNCDKMGKGEDIIIYLSM